MTAKGMRSFAAGLIVAAGVLAAVYYSGPTEETKAQAPKSLTEEEMKTTLASSGYVILTEEELNEQLAAVEQKEPKQEAVKEQKDQKEKVVYRTIINVASGMTSIDVGNALVQGKIIDNAKTFFNEVEKRGLSNELRPGTFELDSSMTMDEVIAIIFK
ncbi:hypothetical protein [Bacillus dakarensis]|uniref:hypothetical protein n=1 Tax=Robertmurraya dakarensis TaxID=1926278 RepID=UPI000981CD4D|nr:hypothetical protein [Bacillus dakarensis]